MNGGVQVSAFSAYSGKKVLITGHTGFKGSWLTLWLTQLGAKVVGYSDSVPTKPSHFELLDLSSKIKDYRGDVRDLAKLKSVIDSENPDIVFHLGAKAIVRECYENPVEAMETNVVGTLNVLECLRQSSSVKAGVFVTSDKCYENVEWEYGYRETDRLGGKDPYSASKAGAEIVFKSYYQSYFKDKKCGIGTTRAGNVIGGADWARDRIVPDAIRAWSTNQKLTIRNPNATRPWQLVLEPLSGYLLLGLQLLEQRFSGEAFNFGPRAEVAQPVGEVISELSKNWDGAQWEVTPDTSKKEAGLLKLSCDKALHHLNWQPVLNFSETLQFTSEWYKNYYLNKQTAGDISFQQIEKYQRLAQERNISWTK
jgi:CDP-glucose 4,6-dehydratase